MAAGAAVFLSVAACAVPGQQGQTGTNHVATIISPSPSPSPTPTTVFAAAGPGFHVGEVGVAYAPVAMTATGGVAPYHWSVASGAVPLGLNVGDDGTLSGVPTSPGKYNFTIQAADSGDSKATIAGSITIADRLNASLIPACAKYCVVELGCTNACGNFGTLTGGVGPFTYQPQGQLPSGTTLSALSLTGTFTGLTGYLQFTVQVTDSLGATDTVSPTFWMYAHVSMQGGSCNSYGGCVISLAYSGGLPNHPVSVKPTAWLSDYCAGAAAPTRCYPEPTFTVTYGPGVVNVTLRYGPNYPMTGGALTLQITDNAPCGGSACSSNATLTVISNFG